MNKNMVAERIASRLLGVQRRFALFMNKRIANCSVMTVTISFSLLCMLFCSLSTWFVIDAFGPGPHISRATIQHFRIAPLVRDKELNQKIMTAPGFQKLEEFHHYMDSLKIYNTAKYDSFLAVRPGMMDSVALIEKIYLSQKK